MTLRMRTTIISTIKSKLASSVEVMQPHSIQEARSSLADYEVHPEIVNQGLKSDVIITLASQKSNTEDWEDYFQDNGFFKTERRLI